MHQITEPDDATATLRCQCSGKLLGDLLHASLTDGLVTHVLFFIDIITDDQSGPLGSLGIDSSTMRLLDTSGSDPGFILEIEVEIKGIHWLQLRIVHCEPLVVPQLMQGE